MLTVLQINSVANWGSTGKIAEQIGLVAIRHGWESYIAYGRNANPSKSQLIRIGGKWSKYLHGLYSLITGRHGLGSFNETKRFIKQIEKIKPDIIHLHNIHGYYINYKLLFEYIKKENIPVVWTLHDCWSFTGHCAHFVEFGCEKWKNRCEKCPQRKRYPRMFVDTSTYNYKLKKSLFLGCRNMTIVPVSDWLGNFVYQSFLKDVKKNVIKNGIDLNIFRPLKNTQANDKFKIIGVSNIWTKSKGLDDMLILRNLLSKDYEITMVGLKLNQIKSLPEGIVGIERTQNIQELVSLYSGADVLINPTYADTFPTVNLEALACGTPVVTYRTGGSPETIDDKTGIEVEQGDIEALAKAVIEMKEHPLSSEDCRKRAEELFDKDKCFQKYIDLYNQILEQ